MNTPSTNLKIHDENISALVEAIGSTDPTVREQARETLVARGREALIPLLHALNSADEQVRWEAAKALVDIKDPASANALVETLSSDDHDLRWLAAEGLIGIGREGLRQVLVALLTHADSIWLRKGAHHVVAHFAHRPSGEYLKPLLELFDDFEPAVSIPLAALQTWHELQQQKGVSA